ncbi:MAG: TIGR03618 family F420-dependent PPOX class oxidoreductase [Pseudonocardiales bacterium]|nr:TIGR03618 family F420-dependent PPOX class oxidoreductase [Pseudonocardiales bacterium]
MPDLHDVAQLAAANGHLAVVSTVRADGTVQASLVSAGVSTHPTTGQQVLAFVAAGRVKLANLRARPRATVTLHHRWKWLTVEGTADLAGPDDPQLGLRPEQLTALLRAIFVDAGGTHDDWPTYDRTMAEERRVAVLIEPTRVYGN